MSVACFRSSVVSILRASAIATIKPFAEQIKNEDENEENQDSADKYGDYLEAFITHRCAVFFQHSYLDDRSLRDNLQSGDRLLRDSNGR
jgi:hypothetical protein